MEKLTGKDKHTVNVGNYPHTNTISKPAIMRRREYKCRILEMNFKLRDQKIKTILYIYRLLNQNFMITANQKSTIDIHTKKKKLAKDSTKGSHQIVREENKRGTEEKRSSKTNPRGKVKMLE